jgi:hypothetical protein
MCWSTSSASATLSVTQVCASGVRAVTTLRSWTRLTAIAPRSCAVNLVQLAGDTPPLLILDLQ